MIWMAPLIMAALSAAKSELADKPAAARKRKMEGEIAKWTPWTHMEGQRTDEPDTLGSAIGGGASGFAMGQNMEDFEGKKAMREALIENMKKGGGGNSVYQGMANQQGDPYGLGVDMDFSKFTKPWRN